jgi:hypothetical protein
MTCCTRCDAVDRWSYVLDGDGDGVEFLVETGHLVGGGRRTETVVFCAPGLRESR